jgi:hypothetical protein
MAQGEGPEFKCRYWEKKKKQNNNNKKLSQKMKKKLRLVLFLIHTYYLIKSNCAQQLIQYR